MIKEILVLGAGSAGLLAALTFKRKLSGVSVRIVRSKELGIIGVGESTTPSLPRYLFDYLGIRRARFYAMAEPTWKLGIHFLWGPRESFEFAFVPQLDLQLPGLARPNGFYCQDEFRDANVCASLMHQKKAFARQPNGAPHIDDGHAFHLYNPKFVETLEHFAKDLGIEFIDGNVAGATRGPNGIESVHLQDGKTLTADFFVDSSGFRSELLGKALVEPYMPFDKSLFCDRAVVGGWMRDENETLIPYTIAETMDAGWCWQIDHQQLTNRGYVYSSNAISDDAARDEFLRKNPRIKNEPRVIKFKSGRYQRGWVDNVLAIGNSCGFVEPLEATALMVVTWQLQTITNMLLQDGLNPTPTMRQMFNRLSDSVWDEIRDFLTLHYTLNTRLDTPFWKAARNESDASHLKEIVEFYQQNGPTGFLRYQLDTAATQFGAEGFLVMLVGNQVPHQNRYVPTESEWQRWQAHQAQCRQTAANGIDAAEALRYVKHPQWRWNEDQAAAK